MDINSLNAISMMATVAVVCAVGTFVPYYYFRICLRGGTQWTWTKRVTAWSIGVAYAFPLAYNLTTVRGLTVSELTTIQFLGTALVGSTFGIYAPLAFVQVYRESWHEWPRQTKAYFTGAACLIFACFLGTTYFAFAS